MTTATDYAAAWTDTGEMAVVTGVATLDGAATEAPVLTGEDAIALAARNAELQAQLDRLGRENAELRARAGAWTPVPVRRIASAADLSETERHLAMVAPAPEYDDDGMPLTPHGDASTWPTWLDEVHHADATWTEAVTDLRAWADSYAARPVEHTSAEPVQISDEYAEKRLAAELQYRGLKSGASVYDELAPERIAVEAAPPSPQTNLDPIDAFNRRHRIGYSGPGPTVADYADAMDAAPEPRRRGWWRRYGDLIAGAVVGLAAFAAIGVAWMAGVLP